LVRPAALAPAPPAAANVLAWSATFTDGVLDRRVQELRQRVESRRCHVLEMIDNDHDDRSRHDAWFPEEPAAPAWG
jgi:hypothetical protein